MQQWHVEVWNAHLQEWRPTTLSSPIYKGDPKYFGQDPDKDREPSALYRLTLVPQDPTIVILEYQAPTKGRWVEQNVS